jgi:hypothetical protein
VSRRKKAAKRRARVILYAVVAGIVLALIALEVQVYTVADKLAKFLHAVSEAISR